MNCTINRYFVQNDLSTRRFPYSSLYPSTDAFWEFILRPYRSTFLRRHNNIVIIRCSFGSHRLARVRRAVGGRISNKIIYFEQCAFKIENRFSYLVFLFTVCLYRLKRWTWNAKRPWKFSFFIFFLWPSSRQYCSSTIIPWLANLSTVDVTISIRIRFRN